MTARAAALAGQLGPLAARLASASTPRTVVHGDFWAGNLLVTGDTVTGVVDWAAGELSGEPLRDVARFALSYSPVSRPAYPPRPPGRGPSRACARTAGAPGSGYAITGQGWFGDARPRLRRRARWPAWARRPGCGATCCSPGWPRSRSTADHPDFAARHRDLLLQLISEVPL